MIIVVSTLVFTDMDMDYYDLGYSTWLLYENNGEAYGKCVYIAGILKYW